MSTLDTGMISKYFIYFHNRQNDWEKSKKLMREVPFKSTVGGGLNFNNDRRAFGFEGDLPAVYLFYI